MSIACSLLLSPNEINILKHRVLTIYQADLRSVMGPFGPHNTTHPDPRIIATDTVMIASGGFIMVHLIEVEVTLFDSNRLRMSHWMRRPCVVELGSYTPGVFVPRLDGAVFGHVLYSASAPDGRTN